MSSGLYNQTLQKDAKISLAKKIAELNALCMSSKPPDTALSSISSEYKKWGL